MAQPVKVLDASALTALVADLARAGVRSAGLVALVVVPAVGVGLAAGERRWRVTADPATVVAEVAAALQPRWVWWDARTTASALVAAGLRIRTCWDLAAVHLVLHGGYRQDPGAVWAGCHDLPEPPAPPASSRRREATLLDFAEAADLGSLDGPVDPVGPDGQLDARWSGCDWASPATADDARRLLDHAPDWAALALDVQARQERTLRAVPDPRPGAGSLPLSVVTSYAESAAALLAVELARDGLPLNRQAAEEVIAGYIGPRPADADDEAAIRMRRDADVLALFPAATRTYDLRNPTQVRDMLARAGFVYPDTRSWRLEPFRRTHVGVAALLDWRKAERIATTYGYGWLDRHVAIDGRLRGAWGSADGGAGRMTAGAGLHNMPAALRVAVIAEPGHVLLRADLGQIEPRVLAAVSGDPALTEATQADDLYAPVAEQLHADRPTAKVAVLAAMYGQTSGAAGEALARMERLYPQAISYLRTAEQSGLVGEDIRTFGGRLIRLRHTARDADESPELANADVPPGARPSLSFGHGRYARNAVVQGAAAEFFKVWAASVRVGLLPLGGRIVLCLHDELLVHVPLEHADAAAEVLMRALDSSAAMWAAGCGVRFVADLARVHRWSDAKG